MTVPNDPRDWLASHVNLEAGVGRPVSVRRATAPTLDRIRALLELLGSPEIDLPVIHVTGTNGKTSTTRMVSSLLGALGLSVGQYTSPNLERINERLVWNDEMIGDADLDDLLRLVALVEPSMSDPPSYFEILTAAALRWFADLAVDVAVVEVGVGGTWDATNLVQGRVAVVTNIAIDHVEYLGPTRELIAQEKAGIIEPGSMLVLGETDPDLTPYFLAREPARVILRDRDFGVRAQQLAMGGRLVDLSTPEGSYPEVFLPLHGRHQVDNAAIALAAAEAFVGAPLPATVVADGFAAVRSPGRLEVVARRPLVLLDGAHNVAGANALRTALDEEFAASARTLVVGLLAEKEPHEMLAALGLDDASLLLCCRPPSPRALDPEIVATAARELGFDEEQIEIHETVRDAIGAAIVATPEDGQIVVTGSLYTVGAARGVFVKP
ncbi:MAG TPA: Mur ligase family protein [Acidimicrobiia bacterium]|nr:Mur ligase family protein [Acidimicrobiia bacterium]